jgi:hypothetical protein
MIEGNNKTRPRALFHTIVRDVHFWIPLLVLVAGLLFLARLD